jgi:F-type H+-transporting ATPase subunit epsilon
MSAALSLTVATPACVLVDSAQAVALRAEDETGSFGILPGHADFLTILTPCVLRWHGADQVPHFCARYA